MTGAEAELWEGHIVNQAPHDPEPSAMVTPARRIDDDVHREPRFAQLTFSNFDPRDGSGGGWQVKEERGGVTATERAALVARVARHFGPGQPVSAYPSAGDLAGRPRRVLYAALPDAGAAWWHTVPAGADSSGRPDNVFAHVVLDRRPDEPRPALRPADLIGARWLSPFGADEVFAATLDGPQDPPWKTGSGDRAAVVSFLVDRTIDHPGVLEALLDAVAAAMQPEHATMVVLGVAEPDDGHRWIAALGHLMSPGTSRRFHWSTAELPDTVAAARRHGLHLAVLALDDLARLKPDPDLVVIADQPDEGAGIGNLGTRQPHVTRRGTRIAVTPWSAIAAATLRDEDLAITALAHQDRIAAEVGDRGLACGWPLAVAVVQLSDRLAAALPAARELLASGTPPLGLERAPALQRLLRGAETGAVGATTADAWAAVEQATAFARDHAVNVYLERAMADHAWLLRAGGAPVPAVAVTALEPDVVEDAAAALQDAPTAEIGLRLVELVDAVGLLGSDALDGGRVLVDELLDRLLGHRLVHPVDGPRLADSIGAVPERVQVGYVRPWLDGRLRGDAAPLGRRVPPAVLRWLFPVPPVPPAPDEPIPPTIAEVAAQALLVVPDPTAFRGVALRARAQERGIPVDADVARLAAGPVWSAAELRGVLAEVEPVVMAPVLRSTLLAVPWDDDLAVVASSVRHSVGTGAEPPEGWPPVERAGELRSRVAAWVHEPDADGGDEVLELAETVLAADHRGPVAADLQTALVAVWVVDLLVRPDAPPLRPALDHVVETVTGTPVAAEVVEQLLRALRHDVLDDAGVAFAALITSPRWAGGRPRQSWWAALTELVVGPEREPLLQAVVRRRVADGSVGAEVAARVTGRLDAEQQLWGKRQVVARAEAVAQWWAATGLDRGDGPAPRSFPWFKGE